MIAFFFYVADLLRGEDLEDLGETCVESSGVFVFCVSQVEGRAGQWESHGWGAMSLIDDGFHNFFEEPHVHPSRVLIFLYEHLVRRCTDISRPYDAPTAAVAVGAVTLFSARRPAQARPDRTKGTRHTWVVQSS